MTKLDEAVNEHYLRNITSRFGIPGIIATVRSDEGKLRYKWFPIPREVQECCKKIVLPTSTFPYTLLNHCRTIKHVASKYGVNVLELRQRVRARKVQDVLLGKTPGRTTHTGPR